MSKSLANPITTKQSMMKENQSWWADVHDDIQLFLIAAMMVVLTMFLPINANAVESTGAVAEHNSIIKKEVVSKKDIASKKDGITQRDNLSPEATYERPRIISTDAGTTEIVVALGQGKSLIGVDVTSSVPEGLAVAKVGYHRNLSAEGLLSLSPNIVFGSEHIGPKETVLALTRANTELVLQPSAKDIDQLIINIEEVAKALNVSSESIITEVTQAKSQLQSDTDIRRTEAKQRAVFLLYLESRGLKQAGDETSGDALIELLGLDNISDYSGYRSVSAEGLLAMQPEVIFVASQSPDAVTSLLSKFPVLQHAPAAKRSKVLFVDAASLVSGVSLKAVNEAVRLSKAL